MLTRLIPTVLAAALITLAAPFQAASEETRTLTWEDLMPTGWEPFDPYNDLTENQLDQLSELMDGSPEQQRLLNEFAGPKMSAPVVGALNNQRVRLPGFVVPMDFAGTKVTEFLLVPYVGACIHVPPPPSNQIVYVKSETAYTINELFDPVWVTGTLKTETFLNELGDAGYTLQASAIEVYEFE